MSRGPRRSGPSNRPIACGLSGDIANCRPIYLPPHPVMRSVASNASYELPTPLRRRGYRRGDERERQIERERRRPRFSSRDVNNDRNDRIRLPCQPPRVTSGPDWVASLSPLRKAAASRDLDREFGSLRCADVTFSKPGNRRKRDRLARVALSLFFPSDLFPFPIPFPFPFLALVRGLLEPLVPRVPPVPCVSLRHEYINAEGVRAVRIYTLRIYADV